MASAPRFTGRIMIWLRILFGLVLSGAFLHEALGQASQPDKKKDTAKKQESTKAPGKPSATEKKPAADSRPWPGRLHGASRETRATSAHVEAESAGSGQGHGHARRRLGARLRAGLAWSGGHLAGAGGPRRRQGNPLERPAGEAARG